MASLKNLSQRLKKVTLSRLQTEVAILVEQSKKLKQEKIDEFESGLRPSGAIIGKYRSINYAIFKRNQNPKAQGNVDLILTGDFTGRLFVTNPKRSVFRFESSDKKAPMLFEKYGDDLKGINQESWDEVQRQLAPQLVMKIKELA